MLLTDNQLRSTFGLANAIVPPSINTTYHHATAILHDTSFFRIRKFISACGVMLLVAVNSIFTVFSS
jgi:hypothetical protein